ncbi:MAG: LacI family transcriptional regulator [Lachnospiraceae bacterium]|nr:LacI family transcriptional regulator [Lachnospiraceae bacterium]
MVSLKDIAKELNISPATVSKALNGQSDVSEETKALVCNTAKKMGYFPNSSARALKTNRTNNIGVLFVDEARSGLTHDYFANVLDSFKQRAEENGYDITFINSNKTFLGMTYLEHCRYRGFDGALIACADFYDPEVTELVMSGLPVVTIDHSFHGHSAVLSDNVKGMRDLITFIVAKGHRKIAYIHGAPSAVTDARLSSFYKTLEEFDIHVPDEYIAEAPYRNTKISAAATEKIISLKEPPTCILYPDDFACFGGINVIQERGLKIPDDISIAGYDGIRIGRHIEPQLTTLRQDTRKIGTTAAQKLIDLIERPRTTIEEMLMIEGSVYIGKTVKNMIAGY